MILKVPDSIDRKGLPPRAWLGFTHWLKSKGIDISKPYMIHENHSDMSAYIRQDDKYYHKWIGDEYIE